MVNLLVKVSNNNPTNSTYITISEKSVFLKYKWNALTLGLEMVCLQATLADRHLANKKFMMCNPL